MSSLYCHRILVLRCCWIHIPLSRYHSCCPGCDSNLQCRLHEVYCVVFDLGAPLAFSVTFVGMRKNSVLVCSSLFVSLFCLPVRPCVNNFTVPQNLFLALILIVTTSRCKHSGLPRQRMADTLVVLFFALFYKTCCGRLKA